MAKDGHIENCIETTGGLNDTHLTGFSAITGLSCHVLNKVLHTDNQYLYWDTDTGKEPSHIRKAGYIDLYK